MIQTRASLKQNSFLQTNVRSLSQDAGWLEVCLGDFTEVSPHVELFSGYERIQKCYHLHYDHALSLPMILNLWYLTFQCSDLGYDCSFRQLLEDDINLFWSDCRWQLDLWVLHQLCRSSVLILKDTHSIFLQSLPLQMECLCFKSAIGNYIQCKFHQISPAMYNWSGSRCINEPDTVVSRFHFSSYPEKAST